MRDAAILSHCDEINSSSSETYFRCILFLVWLWGIESPGQLLRDGGAAHQVLPAGGAAGHVRPLATHLAHRVPVTALPDPAT